MGLESRVFRTLLPIRRLKGGMSLKRVFSILVLTAMLCTLVAGVVLAEEPGNNLITAIGVKGNNVIPSEQILSVVKTKIGQKIDNEKLRADMQAVFELGYFFNVQVLFEPHMGGVKLIFDIVENPKLKDVTIKGTKVISEEKIKELMNSKIGQMLNTKTLREDITTIEKFYNENGYILAFIEDVNVAPEGSLTITINEGFINDIKIKGNEKTKEYVIRREIKVKPGDIFDLKQIQEDMRDVANLGFFNNVQPRIERIADSGKVDLIIEVEENKTGNFQVGAVYSTKDGFLGYLEVKEQNLLGRAQKLGFKWEFGQTTNYELNFYDPWLFGEKFSFGADLYNTTRRDLSETNPDDKDHPFIYDKNSIGASLQIGRPIYEDIMGSVKFKYEHTTLTYQDGNDDDFDPDKPKDSGDTRSLTFSAARDTTDNIFNPHTGNRITASLEYAGQLLGGKNSFTKYNFEVAQYYPGFKQDHTWAFRLKTGLSPHNLPKYEEYAVGGSETLRGYKPSQFTGNKMLLLNAEYRIPIVKSIEGVLFTDSGYAWAYQTPLKLSDMEFSIGAGVRLSTPLGQIRLDYAFGDEWKGMPHFSIGQTF